MHQIIIERMTQEADHWAAKVWRKTVSAWEIRKQDYNYRRFVARPAMLDALKQLGPVKNGTFLDLGCGDGNEMRHIGKFLARHGSSGKLYGFDLQQSLIDIARSEIQQKKLIETIFDYGELPGLVKEHGFWHNIDRIFSTFLLQELSDAEDFFKMSSDCLIDGGWGIFLLLHPAFGKAMRKKKAVRIQRNLGSLPDRWRWAAKYPIVEEDGKTFYVPYFHRELEDYLGLAQKHFSTIRFLERKPSACAIRKCRRKRLSPFYDHPENAYYPEIIAIPSSLVLMVQK
jgi:SAM-dependent methyltransferase